jgi:hypothetical protein
MEGKDSVALKGGGGTLKKPKQLRTVGSYWPHAATTFDYVRRAMPFDKPGTLSDRQVYPLTAYVLYINGLVKENEVIDAQGLPKIRIPTRDGFVADPQPDVSSRDRNDRRSQFVACRAPSKEKWTRRWRAETGDGNRSPVLPEHARVPQRVSPRLRVHA